MKVTKPIYYSDWHRHWYRLADAFQSRWAVIAPTRLGRFVVLLGKTLGLLWLIAVHIVKWLVIAMLVIGPMVCFVAGKFALSPGSMANKSRR